MKRYYSKVSTLTKWIIWGSVLLMWGVTIPILTGEFDTSFFIMVLIVCPFTIFMASIYFNTYYQIDGERLIWKTGPFKGQLAINEIRKIKRAESILEITSMIKPILSQRPLLLFYSRYDDLPISPQDEEEFIDKLITINSSIELKLHHTSEFDQVVESNAS